MAKITYINKEIAPDPLNPVIPQQVFTPSDANEIKASVNALYDSALTAGEGISTAGGVINLGDYAAQVILGPSDTSKGSLVLVDLSGNSSIAGLTSSTGSSSGTVRVLKSNSDFTTTLISGNIGSGSYRSLDVSNISGNPIRFRDGITQRGAGDYEDYSANKQALDYVTLGMQTTALSNLVTLDTTQTIDSIKTFISEQQFKSNTAGDFVTFINGGRIATYDNSGFSLGSIEINAGFEGVIDLSGRHSDGVTFGNVNIKPDSISFGHPAVAVYPVKMNYDPSFGQLTIGDGLPSGVTVINSGAVNSSSLFSTWDDTVSSSSMEANKQGTFIGRQDGTNDQTFLITTSGMIIRDAIDEAGLKDYGDYTSNKGPRHYATKIMVPLFLDFQIVADGTSTSYDYDYKTNLDWPYEAGFNSGKVIINVNGTFIAYNTDLHDSIMTITFATAPTAGTLNVTGLFGQITNL